MRTLDGMAYKNIRIDTETYWLLKNHSKDYGMTLLGYIRFLARVKGQRIKRVKF